MGPQDPEQESQDKISATVFRYLIDIFFDAVDENDLTKISYLLVPRPKEYCDRIAEPDPDKASAEMFPDSKGIAELFNESPMSWKKESKQSNCWLFPSEDSSIVT